MPEKTSPFRNRKLPLVITRLFLVVIFIIMISFLVSCSSKSKEPDTLKSKETAIPAAELPTSSKDIVTAPPAKENIQSNKPANESPGNSIVLSYNDPGIYGRIITLNAGTKQEYIYIGHYIPAGSYRITNQNPSGGIQITIYKDGITTVDNVESPIPSENMPILLFGGESSMVSLSSDEYIKLSDGAHGILVESIE